MLPHFFGRAALCGGPARRPNNTHTSREEGRVNRDIVEVKWTEMRGHMKEWWGKLTDDDFDVIAGKRDRLVAKLQEKYGWAKRDAEDEVSRRFFGIDVETRLPHRSGTSQS